MRLIKYEPASFLNDLHNQINQLFGKSFSGWNGDSSTIDTTNWTPQVDIQEQADKFLVLADLPGVAPKDIKISMENGILSLQGERVSESKEEDKNFTRVERFSGSFYRRFSLPDSADSENVTATSKNGVLEIVVPKREENRNKRREIIVTHE